MVLRINNLSSWPDWDDAIAAVAAQVTGHDKDKLAYVLVVTSWDERGQTLIANTSEPEQSLALLLAVLHQMTRPWITGETPEIVPTG